MGRHILAACFGSANKQLQNDLQGEVWKKKKPWENLFWKNWHVVPKTLYASWNLGVPDWRLTFFSVLHSWRTTISLCTSGVSDTITTFPQPFFGPDILELQNLTWHVSQNLVWTDGEIPGMGRLGIIAISTANARHYSVSFCLTWS